MLKVSFVTPTFVIVFLYFLSFFFQARDRLSRRLKSDHSFEGRLGYRFCLLFFLIRLNYPRQFYLTRRFNCVFFLDIDPIISLSDFRFSQIRLMLGSFWSRIEWAWFWSATATCYRARILVSSQRGAPNASLLFFLKSRWQSNNFPSSWFRWFNTVSEIFLHFLSLIFIDFSAKNHIGSIRAKIQINNLSFQNYRKSNINKILRWKSMFQWKDFWKINKFENCKNEGALLFIWHYLRSQFQVFDCWKLWLK